jgi:GT2 family glycosyltransferase
MLRARMGRVASIIIPTRRRRGYLAVTLASLAGQAAERDAEVLVVEDDPADPATAALATRASPRRRRTSSASSTTMSRSGRAGSTGSWTPPRATRTTT